jgi:ATP-dependent Clp protease ATP-binding subunit ClpA
LKPRSVEISIDESARDWFAKNGFDEKLGARPLERLIRREIVERLVDEVLFGALASGGKVLASCKNSKIKLKFK